MVVSGELFVYKVSFCGVEDGQKWTKHVVVRTEKNQQDPTIKYLLLTSVSTCFGQRYAHLQENKGTVTSFGVYWFRFVRCGW